jgi:hypothetical protein
MSRSILVADLSLDEVGSILGKPITAVKALRGITGAF